MRAERIRPRGRASDDGNAGDLEPGDDGFRLPPVTRHKSSEPGASTLQVHQLGIPGLAEIELVLAELERDAQARCGGTRIGLPPEAERALLP